ncbi:MAG TPA: tripartite tricarboxylate transporter TctB family protein [Burkholderiales bacterium]|nr:tripartite tricarboxylate transporter TctB family protein [Burkholderiales bacterium]
MPRKAALILSIGIMLMSAYGIYAATAWPWKAALFPLAIGIPLFCLAAVEALWAYFGREGAEEGAMELQITPPGRSTWIAAGWMLAFFAAVVLLGFPIAVPLFVLLYLKLQGGERWTLSIVITVAVAAIFYGLFDAMLHLPFPSGLLLDWLGLA